MLKKMWRKEKFDFYVSDYFKTNIIPVINKCDGFIYKWHF